MVCKISSNNKQLILEKIDAPQLHEIITDNKTDGMESLFNNIGEVVSNMHNGGIIHGDLTTSNILVDNNMPIFIDFGLGKYSDLLEDKGTDLLVFKKSLTTITPEMSEQYFKWFLRGYDDKKVVKKIDEIEKRGRYL